MISRPLRHACLLFVSVASAAVVGCSDDSTTQPAALFDSAGTSAAPAERGDDGIAVCYPDLPAPRVEVTDRVDWDNDWVTVFIRVENHSEYPNELFRSAPELGECENGDYDSRTTVLIHGENGSIIKEICWMRDNGDLGLLLLDAPKEKMPDRVYIEIWDRRCDLRWTSGVFETRPPAPSRQPGRESAGEARSLEENEDNR